MVKKKQGQRVKIIRGNVEIDAIAIEEQFERYLHEHDLELMDKFQSKEIDKEFDHE